MAEILSREEDDEAEIADDEPLLASLELTLRVLEPTRWPQPPRRRASWRRLADRLDDVRSTMLARETHGYRASPPQRRECAGFGELLTPGRPPSTMSSARCRGEIEPCLVGLSDYVAEIERFRHPALRPDSESVRAPLGASTIASRASALRRRCASPSSTSCSARHAARRHSREVEGVDVDDALGVNRARAAWVVLCAAPGAALPFRRAYRRPARARARARSPGILCGDVHGQRSETLSTAGDDVSVCAAFVRSNARAVVKHDLQMRTRKVGRGAPPLKAALSVVSRGESLGNERRLRRERQPRRAPRGSARRGTTASADRARSSAPRSRSCASAVASCAGRRAAFSVLHERDRGHRSRGLAAAAGHRMGFGLGRYGHELSRAHGFACSFRTAARAAADASFTCDGRTR